MRLGLGADVHNRPDVVSILTRSVPKSLRMDDPNEDDDPPFDLFAAINRNRERVEQRYASAAAT